MDLLADKVTRSPLELYLTDYEGPSNYEAAVSYFRRTFVRCNREDKTIYTHVTCATDTRQIKCEYPPSRDIAPLLIIWCYSRIKSNARYPSKG